ncbi:Cytochrome c [Aureliella helgolandensis]|uniref:Cytochrome c n=1 Tax=Aureliella helgolandensis TaxID=2527968 RepID=A0A518G570_9BACT|nr:Cytochrome c [Aureliella helgolandensis]
MCLVFFLAVLLVSPSMGQSPAASAVDINLSGPVRIAKLLWKANPQAASSSLAKTINTALERKMVEELRVALLPLETSARQVVEVDSDSEVRQAVALAAILMIDGQEGEWSTVELTNRLKRIAELDQRELVLKSWFSVQPDRSKEYFEHLLASEQADEAWIGKVVQTGLTYDRARYEEAILANWANLPASVQLSAIEPLTRQAGSMRRLVQAVADGKIQRDLINTNQLQKWASSSQQELKEELEQVWGKVRVAQNVARQKVVQSALQNLRAGSPGSASRGALVFERVCSQCHRFRGKGFEVGPDITNNGRGNLEQLASNILDPSLVIGPAFQARMLLTVDGDLLSGILVGESERYIQLKLQGGKIVEFDREQEIEELKVSDKSMMPEGLEAQMTEQELRDLFAYLCLLKPLGAEDNELIPGTPDGFVQP